MDLKLGESHIIMISAYHTKQIWINDRCIQLDTYLIELSPHIIHLIKDTLNRLTNILSTRRNMRVFIKFTITQCIFYTAVVTTIVAEDTNVNTRIEGMLHKLALNG